MAPTRQFEKKLSVIVPCYKVEQYLPRCVDSLLNQTLDGVEIICINDGSPDSCIDILNAYHAQYPDQVIVIDKKNEGVWRGRWDGIEIARGEYIGFVDSDDYVNPEFAESLYTAAKTADADISVCGFERIDLVTGHVLSREMCTPRNPFVIAEEPGRLIELNGAPWNKIFRSSVLKSMRDLPAPPPILDDLMFHLLAYLDMKGSVVFVPQSLVNYMVRSDSIINTIRKEQVEATYNAFLDVKSFYREASASDALLEALDTIAFLHLGISLIFRLSYDKSCNLNEAIKTCTLFLDEHFPLWRRSRYTTFSYARREKGAFQKLWVAKKMYSLHLMPLFLALYRFVIDKLKIDIKW